METKTHGRKPWLAALLSFLSPGLGQFYSGRPKRALTFLFVPSVGVSLSFFAALLAAPNRVAPVLIGCLGVLLLITWIAIPLDAFLEARRHRDAFTPGPFNRWYLYVGFAAIAIAVNQTTVLTNRKYLLEPYVMPAASMSPTLIPGDRFYVDKRPRNAPLERGDLIVFQSPKDRAVPYVKRIVGLPGDKITFVKGALRVNGTELPTERADVDQSILPKGTSVFREHLATRSYLIARYDDPSYVQADSTFEVPQGQVFVAGDNRDNSYDSRAWGGVPTELVLGRPLQIWFSIDPESKAIRWNRIGLVTR